MRYELDKIRQVHIELTNKCNARCPTCPRSSYGKYNERIGPMTELYLSDIQRIFDGSKTLETADILFCGNYGDPCFSRDILEISEWFRAQPKPKSLWPEIPRNIMIHTNGGMKKPEFWRDLASLIRKGRYDGYVTFSVDGLSDTNHIFRKNVQWDRVWENMNTFIEHGGNARWEYIIFSHNKHQVEEAKNIASDLGIPIIFKHPLGFDGSGGMIGGIPYVHTYDSQGNYEYSITAPESEVVGPVVLDERLGHYETDFTVNNYDLEFPLLERESDYGKSVSIKCRSFGQDDSWGEGYSKLHTVYVTCRGIVYPCCYMHGQLENPPHDFSTMQLRNTINLDNFDTKNKFIDDIIMSDEMYETFHARHLKPTIEEGRLLFCADSCGECSPLDRLYNKFADKTTETHKKIYNEEFFKE